MEAEKKPDEAGAQDTGQAAPQDALEKTNEELGNAAASQPTTPAPDSDGKPPKKLNPLKKFFRRFNVYLLLFILIVIIAAVFSVVSFLNSKKAPKAPSVATQTLTSDALKQLANSDATVGDSGQTLTVQGNAVFSGQVLVQKDLNVAGTIKTSNPVTFTSLTASGQANLANTQINALQVANGSTFQGTVTIQHDLNVGGAASFSGPVTAGQITVTKLIMSGNAQLEVPNHLAFTGPSPGRSFNGSVLGGGGSASINGSDTAGTVNVNSGNNPSTGCFITNTFAKPFTNTPHVIVSPVGAAAGQGAWYVTRSTTSFSICVNSPYPANQNFAYDYFITD